MSTHGSLQWQLLSHLIHASRMMSVWLISLTSILTKNRLQSYLCFGKSLLNWISILVSISVEMIFPFNWLACYFSLSFSTSEISTFALFGKQCTIPHFNFKHLSKWPLYFFFLHYFLFHFSLFWLSWLHRKEDIYENTVACFFFFFKFFKDMLV